MIRKRKNFSRPKKAYEKSRISEENGLVEKYGLKNKREIWKTLTKVNYYRGRAKDLAKAGMDEQQVLYGKLRALGLKVNATTDVLALQVEDILRRRLPSVMHKLGMAKTPRQARQLVVHKKVRINGSVVNAPSYLVPVADESKISIDPSKVRAKPAQAEQAEQAEQSEASA